MDGDKKDQLPSIESTSTTAKMKAIQPKKLPPCRSDQVFVPYMKSHILGPYFVSPPPIPFKLVYPQLKDHPFPFQVKPNWSKWVGQVGPWPTWRKSKSILSSALLFWTVSFNCFHFPCGIMFVSLFNISSLTGLPCTAEEISALLTMPLGIEYDHKDLKPSFPAFMRSACNRSPTKEFIPLVVALVHGRHLALALFLFFNTCSVLSIIPSQALLTYSLMSKDATENKKSFEECFKFFASLPIDRLDADFTMLLTPLPLTKKLEEKDVIEEGGDLESARDPIEEKSDESGEDDSGFCHSKFGDQSSPATKSFIVDITEIDDDLENELLAKLDMLANLPVKLESTLDNKRKIVAEETNSDVNLPSQEQIRFAILTLQELIDGDPSDFCRVPDQQVAFQAAQVMIVEYARKFVAYSTTAVFKKKDEFLAVKDAHTAQIKHLQGLREEISNLEAKLVELRKQIPLVEQAEKSLAEQRNKLCANMEVGLKPISEIKAQLPSFTASADEAAEELKKMREEWSNWQSNFC
ncbi:hypothetical protein SLEP1_g13874 [Rubroshorea leprosula]|uniref:Uncharacterized protein n=1 Tax=Rubroshorea leprosula TaxID=152421 RepID=A0AAV5ITT4_9ROSI|nr:hypothetical protein SLEP1_g13874 [Rubroshorea leprosula]